MPGRAQGWGQRTGGGIGGGEGQPAGRLKTTTDYTSTDRDELTREDLKAKVGGVWQSVDMQGQNRWSTFTYDNAHNRETATVLGLTDDPLPNALNQPGTRFGAAVTHDHDGNMTSDGTPLPGHTFGYGFDDIGNRLSATRETFTDDTTPNLLNQIDTVDYAGRLHLTGSANPSANLTVDGVPATRDGALFYGTVGGTNTYESFSIEGTLPGVGDGGADAISRVDLAAFIPEGSVTPSYDASGNLVEDVQWTYTWDAENRLVGMETHPAAVTAGAPRRRLTFEYDSQSRRTRKTVQTWNGSSWETADDTRFLWDGWLLVAELEAESLFPLIRATASPPR